MQTAGGMCLEPEMVMPMFLGTAIVFVALSLLIVLLVRPVPAKLILRGVVTMAEQTGGSRDSMRRRVHHDQAGHARRQLAAP